MLASERLSDRVEDRIDSECEGESPEKANRLV
jgi:hypothetical protein